eukprot:gnl/MRDRNA2_/MRDRNA2_28115_c0_seq1.p1 gnl/MRDRNA2_/MRDRNA2_28115_c0~~gnl/MRDRNA2_/MRDRNA2_28115_c0_seq1.p1  ORF type:complete len:335 (-),score=32.61 gnl/MRDRNA2_/MRDRNA2_28115_c0_seq1:595-1599(-)
MTAQGSELQRNSLEVPGENGGLAHKLLSRAPKGLQVHRTDLDVTILGKGLHTPFQHTNERFSFRPLVAATPCFTTSVRHGCHVRKFFPPTDGLARVSCTLLPAHVNSMATPMPWVLHDVRAPAACILAQTSNSDIEDLEEPSNRFIVAIFQSRTARLIYRRLVNGFQCPDKGGWEGKAWSAQVSGSWYLFRSAMVRDEMEDKLSVPPKNLPMLALNGSIPCAAALYSDAGMNDQNTFILGNLIRNDGEDCAGAGAAILCHLIRNSKNRDREFSPLKLKPIINEPKLERYYESFGCATKSRWMDCDDPNPRKCEQYANKVLDVDHYLGDVSYVGL